MPDTKSSLFRTFFFLLFITSFSFTAKGAESPVQVRPSDASVLAFANQASVASYNYSFGNYKEMLQKLSSYYTSKGWTSFMSNLTNNGNLDTIVKNKVVVTAIVLKPPTILQQGSINGVYTWTVQIPLQTTYKSETATQQQPILLTLSIVQTGTDKEGLAINQIRVDPWI